MSTTYGYDPNWTTDLGSHHGGGNPTSLEGTLASIHGLGSYIAYGQYLDAQKQKQTLKDILARGGDIPTTLAELIKVPGGIPIAQHLAGIAKDQAALSDAARQRSVREPGFVGRFMTPGAPAAPAIPPDPQEVQQSADLGTPPTATVPARPATPAGFDAQGYLRAAAAAGAIDPMALAKEQLAEQQPKFAPGRSPGYFQNGKWVATPENAAQPTVSPHIVKDSTSSTGWSYEDFKTGKRMTGAPPPPNQELALNPIALKSAGAQIATGMPITQVIAGYGRNIGPAREAARQEAIGQIKASNPGMEDAAAGEELANRQIQFAAGKRSVTQLNTMLGATRQAVDQLDFNVKKVTEQMDKLGTSGITDLSPVINAIARGEQKWTGNPAYSALYFYMHAAAMESARILQGGQASIAQLHQGAADEAKKWASASMTTPKAWNEGVAPAMIAEGAARIKTYERAIGAQRVGTPVPGSSPYTTPNAPAALPAGIPVGSKLIGKSPQGADVYQSPDGKKWTP